MRQMNYSEVKRLYGGNHSNAGKARLEDRETLFLMYFLNRLQVQKLGDERFYL